MHSRRPRLLCATLMLIAVAVPTACGSGGGGGGGAKKGSTLKLTIREKGKAAQFTAPGSVKGGLVKVSLKNAGKMPHTAQFALIEGKHTSQEALKIIASSSNKTPNWLRAEGGVSTVLPGKTGKATLNLPPGKYLLTELGGPGSMGSPAHTDLQVKPGKTKPLPSTKTTITGEALGKDRYGWRISGPLKVGINRITFKSEGSNAIHFIGAFRVNGNPSQAEIIKALSSNGKPPAFVDQMTFVDTAVVDGGKSIVAALPIMKPGRYVIFCPLTDRDGGKEHFQEGMLTQVSVK